MNGEEGEKERERETDRQTEKSNFMDCCAAFSMMIKITAMCNRDIPNE
jgi:hypothetical protein